MLILYYCSYLVYNIREWNSPYINHTTYFFSAKIKGSYPVSYAGAFVVVTAIEKTGIIVTGDQELKRVEMDKIVEILWIKNV